MAPNITSSPTGVLFENDIETVVVPSVELKNDNAKPPEKYRRQIVWRNIILFAYLHLAAVYGAYLMLASAKILTAVWGVYCSKFCLIYCFSSIWFVFQEYFKVNDGNQFIRIFFIAVIAKYFLFTAILLYQAGGLGITAGAHRLWAHRSYKAKWPLRLILMIFNTLAFQVSN